MAYNLPDLPFGDISNRTRGGMRRQGPVDRFDESVGEATRGMPSMGPFADRLKRLFPQGQMPPELLQMLMARLMAGQGGPQRGGQRPPSGGAQRRPPMGGGMPPMGRPPMGGGRPPMGRPPMGGPQRGGQRPPMGGGRPPVIKIEDLVRALSGGGAQRQAPQANMPVPQARR